MNKPLEIPRAEVFQLFGARIAAAGSLIAANKMPKTVGQIPLEQQVVELANRIYHTAFAKVFTASPS